MDYLFTDILSIFTPTIIGSTSPGVGTYTSQKGHATRVSGNLIFVTFTMTWTAHTGTGNLQVGNLPFTVDNITDYGPEFTVKIENINWPPAASYIVGESLAGTNKINILSCRSNQPASFVAMDSSGTLNGSGFFLTEE